MIHNINTTMATLFSTLGDRTAYILANGENSKDPLPWLIAAHQLSFDVTIETLVKDKYTKVLMRKADGTMVDSAMYMTEETLDNNKTLVADLRHKAMVNRPREEKKKPEDKELFWNNHTLYR